MTPDEQKEKKGTDNFAHNTRVYFFFTIGTAAHARRNQLVAGRILRAKRDMVGGQDEEDDVVIWQGQGQGQGQGQEQE